MKDNEREFFSARGLLLEVIYSHKRFELDTIVSEFERTTVAGKDSPETRESIEEYLGELVTIKVLKREGNNYILQPYLKVDAD